jgi:phage FluMu protein Com
MAVSPLPLSRPADDCRCACGSLLARLVPAGVELKCRRCKRTHVVPLSPTRTQRPEATSPESDPRAARARRTRWLDPCDEVS